MFSIVLTTKLGVDHGVAHDTLGRTRGDSLIHPSNGEAGEPRAGLARHGGASLVAAHLIALEDLWRGMRAVQDNGQSSQAKICENDINH